jgi:hypothetical protein
VRRFDEEWKAANIKILCNCCCGVPCLPAWLAVPDCLVKFNAVRQDEHGDHWVRNTSQFGGPYKPSYDLVTVYNADGSKGAFYDDLVSTTSKAPARMLISR